MNKTCLIFEGSLFNVGPGVFKELGHKARWKQGMLHGGHRTRARFSRVDGIRIESKQGGKNGNRGGVVTPAVSLDQKVQREIRRNKYGFVF